MNIIKIQNEVELIDSFLFLEVYIEKEIRIRLAEKKMNVEVREK